MSMSPGEIAAAHPSAMLPCPACAASVKAENLAKHIEKTHGGQVPSATTWRGKGWLFPKTLVLDGSTLVLGRKHVALPCSIAYGSLVTTRLDPTMTSYADDMNVAGETVRAGQYMCLDEVLTIGTRQSTHFSSHWTGATRSGPRRRADITVSRESFVAIEYALAACGALRPRGT